jgi:peptidylprolyl isomerase
MKRLSTAVALVLTSGCMLHREKPLPAPIPQISGEKHEIEVELNYIDFVKGTGPMVEPRKCIYTHYTGWLTNGTRFDSSRDTLPNGQPRPPLSFNQGSRRVIMGWDMGFEGMRVGGKRRLIIPYQLAYGEAGRAPIPPRSTLIFDVELLGLADTLRTADAPAPQGGGRGGPPVAVCPSWDTVKPK